MTALAVSDTSTTYPLPTDSSGPWMMFNLGPSPVRVQLGDATVTADDATTTTLLRPTVSLRFGAGSDITHIAVRTDHAGGTATLDLSARAGSGGGDDVQGQLDALQAQVEAQIAAVEDLQTQVAALQAEDQNLQTQITALQVEDQNLQTQIDTLSDRVTALETAAP